MENKVVLIIGAGFSLPAGIPIQDAILEKMLEKPKFNNFMDDTSSFKNITLKFLNAYVSVVLFLLKEFYSEDVEQLNMEYKIIVDSNSFDNDEKYDVLILFKEKIRKAFEKNAKSNIKISLEDVFTFLDKTISNKGKIDSYYFSDLINIKNSLLLLFIYYFNIEAENFVEYYNKYASLIEYIIKNRNHISIITTNWDVLLERYLDKSLVSLDYAFNKPYFINDNRIKTKEKISFIKIHGSTNWFSCVSCNNIVNLKLEDENFIYNDEIEEKCTFCCSKAGINEIQLRPEIITPTMIKQFDSQLFNNIWKSAYDELASANKIIFIGYSLPVADFEFRYLLKKGVKSNSKIDVVLWKTDNPSICENFENVTNLLPETRYKRLFYGKEINFYYEGFTSYFDNLIKSLT